MTTGLICPNHHQHIPPWFDEMVSTPLSYVDWSTRYQQALSPSPSPSPSSSPSTSTSSHLSSPSSSADAVHSLIVSVPTWTRSEARKCVALHSSSLRQRCAALSQAEADLKYKDTLYTSRSLATCALQALYSALKEEEALLDEKMGKDDQEALFVQTWATLEEKSPFSHHSALSLLLSLLQTPQAASRCARVHFGHLHSLYTAFHRHFNKKLAHSSSSSSQGRTGLELRAVQKGILTQLLAVQLLLLQHEGDRLVNAEGVDVPMMVVVEEVEEELLLRALRVLVAISISKHGLQLVKASINNKWCYLAPLRCHEEHAMRALCCQLLTVTDAMNALEAPSLESILIWQARRDQLNIKQPDQLLAAAFATVPAQIAKQSINLQNKTDLTITPTPSKCCARCFSEEAASGHKFSLCGQCKATRYCSKECQVSDWKTHKQSCRTVKFRSNAVNEAK